MIKSKFVSFVVMISFLASPSLSFAQLRQTSEQSKTSAAQEKKAQALVNANNPDSVKLIISSGFENFIKELNDNGKAGYRLDKSLNFGGEGSTQSFAAVLRLNSGNTYEYDWLSSPNKNLLESRLNQEAAKGFNLANSYALTACSDAKDEDGISSAPVILRLTKGDAFLLERINGGINRNKEYKVFIGKIGLGGKPQQALQDALETIPPGFRPVKILFTRQGLTDFSISILLEKNVLDDNAAKIEYRFLKEVSGFEKAVNSLALQGFRFVAGKRIGLVKLVLMAKLSTDATAYTFVDTEKYPKEFDKTIAQGNTFAGIMAGDLSCGSTKIENEKLVFVQNDKGEKHDFKIYKVLNEKSNNPNSEMLAEFQRQSAQGYQINELFYASGLNVVFGK